MRIISIIIVVLLAFAVFACSSDPVVTSVQPAPTQPSVPALGAQDGADAQGSATQVTAGTIGTQRTGVDLSGTTAQTVNIDMTVKNFAFTPGTITVHKGDTVVLHIVESDTNHGIAIPDFNVDESFGPDDLKTITFVADKTGTFDFFCNVPCGPGHREMRGQLIVL